MRSSNCYTLRNEKRKHRRTECFCFFYISFGILLTFNQEKIIYQPFPQDFHSCDRFAEAEKVTFNGTRMYVHDTHKHIAVLYHGNAGSACDRDLYANVFTQAGLGYVIVEYAGYSNDSRTPSHDRSKEDVRNVIGYLREENISNISIVGESIGAGAASYHTSLQAPKKLILVSPFTDLHDIARNRFWFYPTSLLVDNAFDNQTALQSYEGNVLIVHGDNDTLIPHKLGQVLFDGISTEKAFVLIDGAGHNDLFRHQQTYTAIREFLTQE